MGSYASQDSGGVLQPYGIRKAPLRPSWGTSVLHNFWPNPQLFAPRTSSPYHFSCTTCCLLSCASLSEQPSPALTPSPPTRRVIRTSVYQRPGTVQPHRHHARLAYLVSSIRSSLEKVSKPQTQPSPYLHSDPGLRHALGSGSQCQRIHISPAHDDIKSDSRP